MIQKFQEFVSINEEKVTELSDKQQDMLDNMKDKYSAEGYELDVKTQEVYFYDGIGHEIKRSRIKVSSLKESQNTNNVIEDIFFIWDDTVDDDRKDIEGGHSSHKGKETYRFDFTWKSENKEFIKQTEELLKKNKINYDYLGDQLHLYK